ncbi:hypothetical protein HWV62_39429 [Athelia sp. TMB]|nr:hypothetical protein HWV62_39429 [Athelia sp. TMB]
MDTMEVDSAMDSAALERPQPPLSAPEPSTSKILDQGPVHATMQPRESFREIAVKVHIRRPEKDSWVYLGRALVSQEVVGQASRVVVRAVQSQKIIAVFGEMSDLQAEKRGNFVVLGCVEGSRVISWSLNALNNSETLRLMASIELACYRCKQALADPRMHNKSRRRIERVIKDDRRRRHRRRKDADAMVDAFAKQNIGEPVD